MAVLRRFVTARYAIAFLAVAAAIGLRLALEPVLGNNTPYLTFFAAVIVARRASGRGPALAASGLSVVSAWYLFLEPRYSFALADRYAAVGLGLFAVTCAAISWLEISSESAPETLAASRSGREYIDVAGVSVLRRIALIGVAALALGILASSLWTGLSRSIDAERWVEHTYQVINAAASVRSELERAQTSERGYLLTGDDQYAEAYQSAVAAEQRASALLRRLTADSGAQQARLDDLDRLLQARLDMLAYAIQVRKQQGPAAVSELIRTVRGGKLMDELRAGLGAVDEEEHRLLSSRTAAAQAADSRTRWVLGLGMGSLVLLLVLAGASIERHAYKRTEVERMLAQQAGLIDLSHDAIITADGQGLITGWNMGAQEMYGWTGKEAAGKTTRELLQTSSSIPVQQIGQALAGEGRWTGELTQTRSDGRQIVVESRQVLQRDDSGRLAGSLEIHRDTTERKRAEEALRLSEERFARAFAINPAAVAISRLEDGLYLDVNEAWQALTGYRRDEVIGRSSLDLHIWPTPESRTLFARELGENKSLLGWEQTLLKKSGAPFAALLSAVIVPVADDEVILSTFLDISERQRAAKALRESEERFRALTTASSDAVYRMSPDWREMRSLRGRGFLADTESSNRTWLRDYIYPEDQALVMSAIREATRSRSIFELEHRVFRADGSVGWTFSRAVPVQDGDGQIVEWFGAASDITQRKQAEQEIRRINAELEQRVLDRTAQLESANQELEAFAYSVSHDLRAPLRGIDGWTLAFIEDFSGKCEHLDGKGREYLDRVRTETQRMGHLIDDLLRLSRITRAEMHRDSVDLSRLTESIASGLRERHPQRTLEFSIQPGLIADGDARLLEVVLTNLLENAVKFTGPRAHARIAFESVRRDERAAFAVRDNGVGFDMAFADTLFGAFQRLHSASEFPGTGIGLATVQRIIHRHGGRVWAEAEPDRGATFYFTLGPN